MSIQGSVNMMLGAGAYVLGDINEKKKQAASEALSVMTGNPALSAEGTGDKEAGFNAEKRDLINTFNENNQSMIGRVGNKDAESQFSDLANRMDVARANVSEQNRQMALQRAQEEVNSRKQTESVIEARMNQIKEAESAKAKQRQDQQTLIAKEANRYV